jgi:C4-dicarboxylate transporter DctM subunit
MVLWATMAGISVSDLFLAGFLPGLLMAFALIVCSFVIAKQKGFQKSGVKATLKERIAAIREGGWALLMPVIILGGIYGGICTPTEAGGVVCLYAVIVGMFIYKELYVRDLPQIFFRTVKTTAMVVFMVACANLFGWIMASEQLPARMVSAFLSISDNKYVLMFLVNVALLIAGALMDNVSAMTILCTVLTGIGSSIGIHPIHLGAIIVINFAIGNITPPVGYTLYVASSISGMPFERIAKNCLPMLFAEIVILLLITYVPFFTLAFL